MIGFVTWPPRKKWPSDKANHTCYKLLYVIQGVENSFGKVTSWPQSFWSHMPVNNVASDWPRTFLHPRCFCLAFEMPSPCSY